MAKPVGEFIFTSPTEAFFIRLKLAGEAAILVAFPYILFEIWRFMDVAFENRFRRMIVTAVPVSTFLFYCGGAAAIFVVAPNAMKFLLHFATPQLRPLISFDSYLSFIFWMIIGFGILFQLPLILVALVSAGVVTTQQLAHYRRHAIVAIFIVAAFLTPGPDLISQLILAVPSCLLYEVALWVSRGIEVKRKRETAAN
jgi:sec-independent protein translocase protein TatC